MSAVAPPAELRTPVRGPLILYGVIVVLYAALVGWWVWFFSQQGDTLVELMESAGGAPNPAGAEALRQASREWSRMFLFEGAFLGLLLLGSIWLVVRSVLHEVALARKQRNFVSAVTHELRSPLASIQLYLDSLLLGRAEGEKAKRYLTHARADVDRLSHLVEEVLTTRALTEGAQQIHPELVNLAALAERRAARLTELYPDCVFNIETSDRVPVQADPRSLEQVLDNLVSNAVKYGGAKGPVRVTVTHDTSHGRLVVADQGPGLRGIDPEELTHAFTRGQDEHVRTHSGVGLGLYVVRRLMEAQSGRLELIERDGVPGLAAVVVLPLVPEEPDGDPA
jgi:signal transduction histidine kinase